MCLRLRLIPHFLWIYFKNRAKDGMCFLLTKWQMIKGQTWSVSQTLLLPRPFAHRMFFFLSILSLWLKLGCLCLFRKLSSGKSQKNSEWRLAELTGASRTKENFSGVVLKHLLHSNKQRPQVSLFLKPVGLDVWKQKSACCWGEESIFLICSNYPN